MFKNILLATDGSPASEDAARLAVSLARSHGARLIALYVVDPYPYLGLGEVNPMGLQAYVAAGEQHAAQAHAHVARLCAKEAVPVDLQVCRVEGETAVDGILRTAADLGADLIVVGSHGRSGVRRLMLGSVAGRVVAQSPLPVLVARAGAGGSATA